MNDALKLLNRLFYRRAWHKFVAIGVVASDFALCFFTQLFSSRRTSD
jgi:hypothetical protein